MKLSFHAVLCSVDAQSGCGSIFLVQDLSPVHSPNYPQLYAHDCVLRWVVHAPRGHVVKVGHTFLLSIGSTKHMKLTSNWSDVCISFQLDFADFDLEQSDTCSYDSLTVLGDVEGTEEIGRNDGIIPSLLAFSL